MTTRLTPEFDLFASSGKRTGFIRLPHSVHQSAYGFIPIPVVVIANGEGPSALLMAGNHGDEYEGQVALGNLIRALQPEQIRGRLIVLPSANFPAAIAGSRTSPIDDGNLNRSFPGDPDGTVTEQIAWFIEETILPRVQVLIDLHSGGSSLTYIPSALARRSADATQMAETVALLRAFGAPIHPGQWILATHQFARRIRPPTDPPR
jgi:predicted deacylase